MTWQGVRSWVYANPSYLQISGKSIIQWTESNLLNKMSRFLLSPTGEFLVQYLYGLDNPLHNKLLLERED